MESSPTAKTSLRCSAPTQPQRPRSDDRAGHETSGLRSQDMSATSPDSCPDLSEEMLQEQQELHGDSNDMPKVSEATCTKLGWQLSSDEVVGPAHSKIRVVEPNARVVGNVFTLKGVLHQLARKQAGGPASV